MTKDIPVCPLGTVDFGRLLSQEPNEVENLFQCCKEAGFFYLDLQGIDGRRTLEDYQRLLELIRRFFDSPDGEKNEIGLPSQEHGYEPVGTHAGVVDNTKDGYEILKVSRDELATSSPKLPSIINNTTDIKVLEDFLAGANIITKTMLSCLSSALGLTNSSRFETTHRNAHKSNSTLAMFHYIPGDLETSPCVGHQKHTDIGSLTLLFSSQWGLQVQPSDSDPSVGFVEPRPGCAIVNVGDSLRFASGNKLKSCIHQVVPFDTHEHRYSIAYFLRPEDEARYRDSEGRWITAKEWHDQKYAVFQAKHEEQKLAPASLLLGGMEKRFETVATV